VLNVIMPIGMKLSFILPSIIMLVLLRLVESCTECHCSVCAIVLSVIMLCVTLVLSVIVLHVY
jgi:hypothetical protein